MVLPGEEIGWREVRERATSVEWLAYYERADAVRRRLGDPFKRFVQRGWRRRRLFRLGLAVFGVAAGAGMVVAALWLFNGVDWASLTDGSSAQLMQ